ncbi:DUF1648 domain-containing protein [Macrococcoides canis]|uniref:DUF1648 domain-containing protein n=1 Tax=Macrococcoides canis TaxID=1855823 RepID=UPI0010610627|nr:DUF1648 domain-containing protein [Macrococcus canis]TDM32816.1 DUF1648 domain-containing protein [Macrococcus canis]TDM43356.1 DUF1648 domain-containing protein [Macrococcus canis]
MMEGLLLSGILFLTGLLFLLNGRFVRRNILFSVFVPESETNNTMIQPIKSRYNRQIIILAIAVSLLFSLIYLFASHSAALLSFVVLLHVLIIIAILIYKNAHDDLKAVKISEDWMKDIKVVKATDTSLMTESSPLPNALFVIQLLAFIAAFIFVALNYDRIPETIATHWNIKGEADNFSPKNIISVFAPGVLGLVILLVLFASSKGINFFDGSVNPSAKSASIKFVKKSKLINSMMIHLISFTTTLLFILIFVRPAIYNGDYLPHGIMRMLIAIMLVITVVCLYLQVSEDKKYRQAAASSDKAPYYNEDHYIFGLFYYNPDDSNVWVPKISQMGMTLNMARPMSWFIAFMLIGLPFVIIALITIFS